MASFFVPSFITSGDVAAFGASLTILLSSYYIGRGWIDRSIDDESNPKAAEENAKVKTKMRAWLLTFVTAVCCSATSIYPTYNLLTKWYFADPSTRVGTIKDYMMRDSAEEFTREICVFFIAHCLCDLVVGLYDYPSHFGIVTGWIHHTVYIGLMISFLALGCTRMFAAMATNEIPTMILALGVIHPPFRADWGFGMTFLFTRIIFFTYMWYEAITSGLHMGFCALQGLLLALHCVWFLDWCVGMMKRSKKGKRASTPVAPNVVNSPTRGVTQ